jgi:hypothetical protein
MWIVKRGEHEDQTHAIEGVVLNLLPYNTPSEFVTMIGDAHIKDYERCRFSIIAHETKPHEGNGALCAKSYFSALDQMAVKRSNRHGDMILEALVLTCAHPQHPKVCVNLSYSERYWPGDRDPEFENRAEQILNSLRLEDF